MRALRTFQFLVALVCTIWLNSVWVQFDKRWRLKSNYNRKHFTRELSVYFPHCMCLNDEKHPFRQCWNSPEVLRNLKPSKRLTEGRKQWKNSQQDKNISMFLIYWSNGNKVTFKFRIMTAIPSISQYTVTKSVDITL